VTNPRQEYQLPSGRRTTSVNGYLKGWRQVLGIIERELKLKTLSYGSGATFLAEEGTCATISLPSWFLVRLSNLLREKKSTRHPAVR